MKENKFVIIDFNTMEAMKKEGQIWTFDTEQEAITTCGMYEFPDVWVVELKYNYQEPEELDMTNLKVVKVDSNGILFDNDIFLNSEHEQDCCENHSLSFSDLELKDFDGFTFDLSTDTFFKKIEDYGIELVPKKGWSIKIPGYGNNNGYYSSNLTLQLTHKGIALKIFDISECQEID